MTSLNSFAPSEAQIHQARQQKRRGDRRAAMDHDQITHDNQVNSAFLRLPPELRNQIYLLTLQPDPLWPTIETYDRTPCSKTDAEESLAPLLVRRQMRAEASLLYYSMNTFMFRSTAQITSFVSAVGPVNCRVIKSVFLWCGARSEALSMAEVQPSLHECLRGFPELEKVWVVTVFPLVGLIHLAKPELKVVFGWPTS
jgi:hypothetical protein